VAPPPPAPVAATQPAPPKPFDPVDLVGTPAAWPKMLRLKEAVAFPAVFNGQVVGDVTVPAGAVVTLVDIQGEELIVEYQGGRQKLSWKLTDLEEEVAKSGWVAPAAPPATNVTATAAASASSGN